jgi:mannose-6-phosphate isomerase-like protein (cupin superfamily)
MDPARGLLGLPIARTPLNKGNKLLIERITHGTQLLAIVVPHSFRETGIHFFTEAELSQQLAYMHHPAGRIIAPHFHNPVLREVHYTQEVLIIKRGRLRVDFYDETQRYLQSRTLVAGDTIILVGGGHGFEVLEEIEMIEVKQGPYAGDKDKTTFIPVDQPRSE